MKLVLADAGPLVALCHPHDQHHAWAVSRYALMREPLVTCEAALTEALHILEAARGGEERLRKLWEQGLVRTGFDAESQRAALLSLMRKYEDVPMSLADACLARMSELHSDCAVWTCDTHFKLYRRHGRMVVPVIAPWQT